MWTYYKQTYANGMWILFRENSKSYEAYKFGAGWHGTLALFDRKYKGEIDADDEITEQVAFALIRSRGEDPEARA